MEAKVSSADKKIWGNEEEKERTSTKSSSLCMCCAVSTSAESRLLPLVGDNQNK